MTVKCKRLFSEWLLCKEFFFVYSNTKIKFGRIKFICILAQQQVIQEIGVEFSVLQHNQIESSCTLQTRFNGARIVGLTFSQKCCFSHSI